MQIRKLQRRSGGASMSVWPPMVLSGAGTTFVRSGDGVLKRVMRADNHLLLTLEGSNGREAVGRLEWDSPPIAQRGRAGAPRSPRGADHGHRVSGRSMNSRRSLLTAALGFALLDTRGKPAPPEAQTVRTWLDN